MKQIKFTVVFMMMFALAACSKEKVDGKSAEEKATLRDVKKKSFHSDMKTTESALQPSPVMVDLKKNHLSAFPAKTIGEAFDTYSHALKKEWKETAGEGSQFPYFIDYVCWLPVKTISSAAFKEGVVERAVIVKFAIQENGETYLSMVSRYEIKSDGMIHNTLVEPSDINRIVTAIYENREITF